jgi:O-antigen ligase
VTTVAARFSEPRHLAAVGVLLIGAAVGVLAGYDPKLAIAAAIGMAFVLIAVGDLAFGVAIFGALTFLELSPVAVGPAVSFAKLAGLTLAISWLAVLATDRGRGRLLFSSHPALTGSLAFFITWTAISGLWAEDPSETWATTARFGLNIALVPIVFTAIRKPHHLRWVAGGITIGAALAASYGIIVAPNLSGATTSVTAAGDLNRVAGTVGDPNLLASVLVVGLVMSMSLCLDRGRSSPARIVTGVVALLCLVAVFATVSRGGIVALTAALLASVVLAGPRRGRMALGVVSMVIAALIYFAAFASDSQVDRLTSSDGGTGRTDIWRIGWRMVERNPVHGVGAGNFSVSSIHYLLIEPGAIERDEFIVDVPKVAHNMYLERLAENGIVGLAFFLSVLLIGLGTAVRAAQAFDRANEDGLSLIARAVAVGLISTFAADFFLSAELSKLLWLLIGLGPAMLAIATRLAGGSGAKPETGSRA